MGLVETYQHIPTALLNMKDSSVFTSKIPKKYNNISKISSNVSMFVTIGNRSHSISQILPLIVLNCASRDLRTHGVMICSLQVHSPLPSGRYSVPNRATRQFECNSRHHHLPRIVRVSIKVRSVRSCV